MLVAIALGLSGMAVGLTACSSRIWNEEIGRPGSATPYALGSRVTRSDDTFVVLAFSGGGTRAAAFAYGVLRKLASTTVVVDGRRRRLLDDVDVITSVSGGSYTAAYFGLFGDRIFDDFESRFLRRDVQGALLGLLVNPVNLAALSAPDFNRGDLAAKWLDDNIFEHKTFADMSRRARPYVIINASDLNNGASFSFTQKYFDFLCSDLNRYPVANAVMASSSVPVVFGPIALRNFDDCAQRRKTWVDQALDSGKLLDRRYAVARALKRYDDSGRMPIVRLVDGGVTDNLGVRASVLSPVAHDGNVADLAGAFTPGQSRRVRHVLVIVANAQTYRDYDWSRAAREPGITDTLTSSFDAALGILNSETIGLARQGFLDWEKRVNGRRGAGEGRVKVHFSVLTFGAIKDDDKRRRFDDIPTTLALDDGAVDDLIALAGELLGQSPEFRAFVDR
jgi:NTE family protein